MQEIQFRKKREIGDIFTDSFLFLKQEIKPLTKLFAVYVLPFVIVYAVLQIYMQKEIMGRIDINDPEMVLANLKPIYLNLLTSSFFGLFVNSLLAGTFYTYIDLYVKKGKGNFETHEITGALFTNSLAALGAILLLFAITIFGVTLFIIPGIYFANTLSLALFIVIFERKRIGSAFSRSWFLVNKQWWNTFLINLLGLLVIWAASLFFLIPSMMAGFSAAHTGVQQGGAVEYPQWHWFIMGVSALVSTTLGVISYTFIAFQYFNIDERTKQVHNLQEE